MQQGITLPLESQGKVEYAQRREKGLETQRTLFGEAIDKGNATAPKDYQHIRTFLSANCFGDYYTRGGLPLKFRELLTFVYILSMGGADSQVKAHIAGNLRIGNDRKKLIAVGLERLLDKIYDGFVRQGALLPEEKKKELGELKKRRPTRMFRP